MLVNRKWLLVFLCIVILFLGAGITGVMGVIEPPVVNPQTEFAVIVGHVGRSVEYRTDTVEYQGDRLVLTDYYERRGNRWHKGIDALTISGNYLVRQHRMVIMGGP